MLFNRHIRSHKPQAGYSLPRRPRIVLWQMLAIVLACNYFAFRVELFDKEFEANHPLQTPLSAYTQSSLNWESFDKDNAPKAFVFMAEVQLGKVCGMYTHVEIAPRAYKPFRLPRDKSPPVFLFS